MDCYVLCEKEGNAFFPFFATYNKEKARSLAELVRKRDGSFPIVVRSEDNDASIRKAVAMLNSKSV